MTDKNPQFAPPYRPLLAVDVLVFTISNGELQVLLVRRKFPPFENMWAAPGGFVQKEETLEAAAIRELKEETGVSEVYLEQLYTFGQPDRDPRDRVVSVSYFALTQSDKIGQLEATTDAAEAKWWNAYDLPKLAFDHRDIITYAVKRLHWKLEYTNIVYSLLPEEFTLTEMQQVYEIVFHKPFDKRNFRKKILSLGLIRPTGKTVTRGVSRPARTYRFILRTLSFVDIA